MIAPPRWAPDRLREDALEARRRFREERLIEPIEAYSSHFERGRDETENLLETTTDLTRLRELAVTVVADDQLRDAMRYLAGPPISMDDLRVLAEAQLTRTSLAGDPDEAVRATEVVLTGLDRNRFPWLYEDRMPSDPERLAATIATAAMIAYRRVMTERANDAKSAQEAEVAAVLTRAGLRAVSGRTMRTIDDAPARGEFTADESLVGPRKADLTVRLLDGRLMPIECKVSNSEINSIKRLNNDAAAKASRWLEDFGRTQIVPTAVIAGVFKVRHLERAQDDGLTLFWAHDLDPLVAFVRATGSA